MKTLEDLLIKEDVINEVVKKVNLDKEKAKKLGKKPGKVYALLSKDGKQVLKYFGKEKPSQETIDKEEKRINYFKHN